MQSRSQKNRANAVWDKRWEFSEIDKKCLSFFTLLSLSRVVHPMVTFSFSGAQSLRSSARQFSLSPALVIIRPGGAHLQRLCTPWELRGECFRTIDALLCPLTMWFNWPGHGELSVCSVWWAPEMTVTCCSERHKQRLGLAPGELRTGNLASDQILHFSLTIPWLLLVLVLLCTINRGSLCPSFSCLSVQEGKRKGSFISSKNPNDLLAKGLDSDSFDIKSKCSLTSVLC